MAGVDTSMVCYQGTKRTFVVTCKLLWWTQVKTLCLGTEVIFIGTTTRVVVGLAYVVPMGKEPSDQNRY